jgi:hypothetical protein
VVRAGLAGDRRPDALSYSAINKRRETMPVILWLLGVPLSIIILLMLLGGL